MDATHPAIDEVATQINPSISLSILWFSPSNLEINFRVLNSFGEISLHVEKTEIAKINICAWALPSCHLRTCQLLPDSGFPRHKPK